MSAEDRLKSSGFVLPARQKRTEAARDRLLDAAQREFAQHGFNGAIVADLAREAKCSIGSFYRRFKDKEALFFALQEQMHETESANIDRFFDNPRRLSESLDTIFQRLVLNTFRTMGELSGYFRAFVELTQRNAIVWERMTDLEAQQGKRLAELVVSRGLVAMAPELVEKAHLATRTVNGFVITHVLYQPRHFSPREPLVVERLAGIFDNFMDLPKRQS